MVSKAQKIRLGIFIIVACVLLFSLLSLIVGKALLNQQDTYYIAYKNVSVAGLNIGGAVQYHGIRIGRVEEMSIDPEDVSTIIVEISVKQGTPIKKDVKAVLSAVGITGLKKVELVGGNPKEKNIKPGSYITAGKSTIDKITGKAEVIAEKVELVLNNLVKVTSGKNRENIQKIIENTRNSLANLNEILVNNRTNFTSSMENIATISGQFSEVLEIVRNKTEQIDVVKLNETIIDIDHSVKEMNKTINNINYAFGESRENIVYSIRLLKETMQNLNEFSRLISEDPSYLFKKREDMPYYGGE